MPFEASPTMLTELEIYPLPPKSSFRGIVTLMPVFKHYAKL